MNLVSMHRKLATLNGLGLIFVSALYVAIHGFDRQLAYTLGWIGFSAAGTFIGSRWLLGKNVLERESPDDKVDATPYEKCMSDVIFWIPAVLLAISTAAIAALDNPLPSAAWMMIVLGGYIGRDIEALGRLHKRRLPKEPLN